MLWTSLFIILLLYLKISILAHWVILTHQIFSQISCKKRLQSEALHDECFSDWWVVSQMRFLDTPPLCRLLNIPLSYSFNSCRQVLVWFFLYKKYILSLWKPKKSSASLCPSKISPEDKIIHIYLCVHTQPQHVCMLCYMQCFIDVCYLCNIHVYVCYI